MLGWRFSSLRNQFVGEGGLLALVSLMVGNLIYLCSFFYLSGVQVTMELPWDVSAKPHFLPAENNIERVITAPLPMNFDILPHLGVNLLMLGGCVMLTFFVLFRLRHIKPSEFYKG
jgi:ABC-type antimicrobial peptide transport system permease subunit